MSTCVDLNLDAGECPESFKSGKEEALYQLVSSVNVACGGHAGDRQTMRASVRLARKYGLSVGAHPSFPDRENFGRVAVVMKSDELRMSLVEQMQTLQNICHEEGTGLRHVKPHGALYNLAAGEKELADVLIAAVKEVDRHLILVGLAGSLLLSRASQEGLRVAHEAFVDRRYERDGSLRSRRHSDALITDPSEAARQALGLATGQGVSAVDEIRLPVVAQTLCIHGDGTESLAVAQAVRSTLESNGIQIQAIN